MTEIVACVFSGKQKYAMHYNIWNITLHWEKSAGLYDGTWSEDNLW